MDGLDEAEWGMGGGRAQQQLAAALTDGSACSGTMRRTADRAGTDRQTGLLRRCAVVPGSGFGQADGTWHFRTTILPQARPRGQRRNLLLAHAACDG